MKRPSLSPYVSLVLLLLAGFLPKAALADHFLVTSLADEGVGTLRAAITNANDTPLGTNAAHTITFQDGLTGTIHLDTTLTNVAKTLNIIGPGASQITIRRNGSGTYGAFYVTDYANCTNLVVSGLTFKNFNHNDGAIYMIYAQGLTVSNCVFDGNASGSVSGVFANQIGSATISGCLFTNNSGGYGPALHLNGPSAFTVTDCVFANNNASGNGGALSATAGYYADTIGTIQRCSFVGNSSSSAGGAALFNGSGSGRYHQFAVTNCTFNGNYASAHSGAIANGSPYLRLWNCTISGNSAGGSAGGIHCGDNFSGGVVGFNNCTITGNRCGLSDANAAGGGIFVGHGNPRAYLRNTIAAGNTDSGLNENHPDVFNAGGPGGFVSEGWNLIGATNGVSGFPVATDIIGNVAAPVNALLSSLGDFGGPTKTHLLLNGSPAIDQGNVSGLSLSFDQRGFSRVVDDTNYANAADGSDIGSTEQFVATNAAPQIVLQPLSQNVKASSNTVLQAGAIGANPIYYQWRKNGAPISGATTGELALNNLQPWDAGNYDFVATNAFGAQTSQVAVVTVIYFRVSNTNDNGAGSLRQAVTDANANAGADSIYFLDNSLNPLSGTINLDTALPNVVGGLNVFGPGASQLTVRRSGGGTFGAFNMVSGSTDVFSFSGLKFQNFNGNDGAIYVHYHTLAVTNCVFDSNACNGTAGLNSWEATSATVIGCIFTNNSGNNGAALRITGATTYTIADSVFVNNTASSSSGALVTDASYYADTVGLIQRCTFSGNAANNGAGGAASFGGSNNGRYHQHVIRDCTFSGNYASVHSGAFNNGSPYLRLWNCTISGNTAGSYAGGVHCGDNFSGGVVGFNNCTVTGNRCGTSDANGNGGGIYVAHGAPRAYLRNTIVAGNMDSGLNENHPDVFNAAGPGGFVSQGWNLIGATNGVADFTNSFDIIGSVASPVNAFLSPLGNYGGPTQTILPYEGSPALDQGKIAELGFTFDQRGFARVVDIGGVANASGGDGSDIGATEGFLPAPIQITQQPQSLVRNVGQNATFTVEVSGVPLFYQWRKGNSPISGANASSYTIGSVVIGDAGSFDVIISNAVNVVTSQVATLAVQEPPTITDQPDAVTVPAGNDGCLSVAATGAQPITYQWRKDGTNIVGATGASIGLDNLQPGAGGVYDVVITGPYGSVTSLVSVVSAWIPPTISQNPLSQNVNASSNVSFSVTASGTAPLEYQWRRNGSPISDATGSAYNITNAQPYQSSSYDVVVRNGGGSAASSPAALNVQAPSGSGSYTWTTNSIRWQRAFGGTANDSVVASIPTSDGGYLLGGRSASGINGNKTSAGFGGVDGWVVKVDADGNKLWEIALGGTGSDVCQVLQEAVGGGYFVGLISDSGVSGNKTSPNQGLSDYWIVKLATNGAIVWDKNFGSTNSDSLYTLSKSTDGGCVVGGYAYAGVSGNRTNAGFGALDYWILKLDANGNKQWERSYGGTGNDLLVSMQPTSDGGYILSGDSNSGTDGNKSSSGFGSDDFWLVKIDGNGSKIWDKTYGGNAVDQSPEVTSTSDGGYILAGKTQSGISGNKTTAAFGSYDIWVVKTDASGNKQWEHAIGDASTEYPYSILQTEDDGYVISGAIGGSDDIAVTKLSATNSRLWTIYLGGNLAELEGTMMEAADGDLVLAATSLSGISGNKTVASFGGSDMWFVKTAPAQQTVDGPPVLLSVPTNTTARVGQNVNFTVVAANNPTAYLWRFNGGIIPSANTATLSLNNLQLTNAGSFTITVTNNFGSVTSEPFTLSVIQDTDGDGLPDSWETANGTQVNAADAGGDLDGDGMTNWEEYLAGTFANDEESNLATVAQTTACGGQEIGFVAMAGHTYTLQYRTNLTTAPWQRALDIFPAPTNRIITLPTQPHDRPETYYRTVTPLAP